MADIATHSEIPTVNDNTITITQGGVTKGSFTLNQSTDTQIELDAGGGASYTAGTGIDITNDVISVDDTIAKKTDIPKNYVPYTTVADKPYVDIGNYYGSGTERGFTCMDMTNNTHNTYTLPGDKSGVIALTSDIPTVPTLAPVATTGSYNDLTDQPSIPSNISSPFLGVTQTSFGNLKLSADGIKYSTLVYVNDSNPLKVNLRALNPNFGTGLSASFNTETRALDVAIDTTTVALKSEVPTTATSTVTPTTTQLTFTYADNTTETVTLMTAATVTTTLS